MTTNISKQKREELIKKINEIKGFIEKSNDDENKKNLLTYMGDLQKELITKHYGLIFEEHREKIDDLLKDNLPVLTEEKDLYINHGGQQNFLIEGDNLASLQLLEKTHRGKIDLIYIDPPYNTGNKDFIYDDNYVAEDDTFRHSKWCSFMEKRLKTVKNLLTKNGIIFISIDDHEHAALKMLCDGIFGEKHFIADLQVETSAIAGPRRFAAVNGSIVKTAEYILVYTNCDNTKVITQPMYDYILGFDTHYTLFFNPTNKTVVKFVDFLKKTDFIKSYFEKLNLKVTLPNLGKVIVVNEKIKEWLYSDDISKNLFREGDEDFEILKEYPQESISNSILEKEGKFYYISEEKKAYTLFRYYDRIGKSDDYYSSFGERSIRGNLWKGFSADGGNLAKEGYVSFKNGKKPLRLVSQLLKTVQRHPSSTILDFFAGSGTTGHAVLKLNAEDGGNRKFILCTNNENSICRDITYERIKRVIQKENYDASLKYFRVDFIPITDKVYYDYADELLEHTKELVELENAVNFTGNTELAIILTEEELDSFCADEAKISGCKKIYLGHNVASTAEQDALFLKLQISVIRTPNYYYKED